VIRDDDDKGKVVPVLF